MKDFLPRLLGIVLFVLLCLALRRPLPSDSATARWGRESRAADKLLYLLPVLAILFRLATR